ncbi:MAG: bifunctional glycosyltransferase family 2/GtrA family protein [Clostridia bacterium]|nr:bifunctional glycosyltransferase family 2/GtrA family protein [Clostridia bacterium]
MENINKTVVIIPCYEPPFVVNDYVKELTSHENVEVVAVNDGSAKEFDRVFEALKTIEKCTVISYEVNQGKGHALKVALEYCKQNYSENDNFVTADCDGQHYVKDVLSCAKSANENKNSLILGVRDFSLPQVPARSKFGNINTRRMFAFLYGIQISDTQTGLRAFNYSLIDHLLAVKGERFEYEMSMLIQMPRNGHNIVEVPIDTVYEKKQEDVNTRSHFKTFEDSVKVWGVLLGNMANFIFAGLIATLIDLGIFALLYYIGFKNLSDNAETRTLLSSVIARVCSSTVNFLMCKKVVFHSSNKFSSLKYYALWIMQLGASYLFTYLIGNLLLGTLIVLVKAVFDTIISLLSYKIQQIWVFKKNK